MRNNETLIGILIVCLGNMDVQIVSCRKTFCAVLAVIRERAREMNIFDMLPKISSVIANFATKCAFMSLGTRTGIFYNVLIKQTSVFS